MSMKPPLRFPTNPPSPEEVAASRSKYESERSARHQSCWCASVTVFAATIVLLGVSFSLWFIFDASWVNGNFTKTLILATASLWIPFMGCIIAWLAYVLCEEFLI